MRASTDAHSVVHRVLLPKGLQEEVLRDSHDRAGHLGMVKTYQRLRSTYYRLGSRAAVDDYVKTCDGIPVAGDWFILFAQVGSCARA
jgi:hypothetical protein